jgi:CRISPR-associated protein Csb1
MSKEIVQKFDAWLQPDGPAALVVREHLMSVEGNDGVLFPATFAASEDKSFKGGYNIDDVGNGKTVCLVDSVGSQANRIEPLFVASPYSALVPQIVINAGTKKVNLLEAGHRAGDAIVRCSELQETLQSAFKAAIGGDASPLAKIAPTSLVFGVWDSRDTQAKLPRLIASAIRAFDVQRLTRSAQYVPATEYVNEGLLEESDDKKVKDSYAAKGFIHVPASGSPGGVVATGGVRRDATLHLAALRLLTAGADAQKSLVMRRYVLGLALVAFTHSPSNYLRQGCNLVLDPDKKREGKTVYGDGRREDTAVTGVQALEYAQAAAAEFGVGESKEVDFDKARAKADIAEAGTKPKAAKAKKGT